MSAKLFDIAKSYILYREERKKQREEQILETQDKLNHNNLNLILIYIILYKTFYV